MAHARALLTDFGGGHFLLPFFPFVLPFFLFPQDRLTVVFFTSSAVLGMCHGTVWGFTFLLLEDIGDKVNKYTSTHAAFFFFIFFLIKKDKKSNGCQIRDWV